MKNVKRKLILGMAALLMFIVLTVLLRLIDVQPLGPKSALIGFASVNTWFHGLTGVHMPLYTVTDWLGLVPAAICLAFGALGLVQWWKRRKISEVDFDILALGVFYTIVIAMYLLFEEVSLNYRPILIGGKLEASYPSSTTLLTLSVMLTAVWQIEKRIRAIPLKKVLILAIYFFISFMVLGRLISGVHWLTDIIGSVFLSASLVLCYIGICELRREKK